MMGACILPVLCIAVFPAEGGKVGKYDGLMGISVTGNDLLI